MDDQKNDIEALKAVVNDLNMRLMFQEQEMGGAGGGGAMMQTPEVGGIQTWILGGSGASSFIIYLADGTRFEVTNAQAMTGYDSTTHNDWSLEFDVSSSALADYAESGTPAVMTNPLGVSTVNEPVAGEELLHDADASASPSPVAQSYYRLPIIRDGKRVCYGGAFRENTYCSGSKGPVVELLRIS